MEDKKFILASALEFDQYLTSDVLLWRLAGINIPLSPGNLILTTIFLQPDFHLPENADLTIAENQIDQILTKRESVWKKKIRAEIPMRLNQWKIYIEDISEERWTDPSYWYHVKTRAMITLLIKSLTPGEVPVTNELDKIDNRLRSNNQPAVFIWGPKYEQFFPKSEFWFLYLYPGGDVV